MQVSAADRPPGPEPTIQTSTQPSTLPSAPGYSPVASMCSTTARPRLAAFLTSDFADQILAGYDRLEELVDLGDLDRRRRAAFRKHHQRFGRANAGAFFTLDAVLEAQHTALVRDQVEHVGRANGDAGIAAGA